jgi:hypothetical protein
MASVASQQSRAVELMYRKNKSWKIILEEMNRRVFTTSGLG